MRRAPRSLARLALAAALGSGAAPAAAEAPPRSSSLGWVRLPGAEACVGTRELALAVEQRLGRSAFVPPAQAEVFLDGHVAPAGPGFRARLTLSDAHGVVLGTRELEALEGGCRALDEPLALVIALLIEPDAILAARRPAAPPPHRGVEAPCVPAPPPPLPPPAEPPLDDTATGPRPLPPAEPWRESLSLGGAVAAGLLPRAGVALSLRGEIVPPSFFPIEIGGAVWLDATASAASGPSRGATLSLSYAMLGLCPLAWSAGGTSVRACAELEVGAIRSVGFGFAGGTGAGQEQPVGQVGVTGRVSRRLVGPLEIGIGLGLVVPFDRARFFYVDAAGNPQELFRMAAVAAVVDGAIGVAFP